MTRFTAHLWLGVALRVLATGAEAQFEQYTPPGAFEERRESMEDLLDRSIKEARWRWGRAYLHPWVGIRDLAYVDPVIRRSAAPDESDFTATVGAGVRAFGPIGSELTLALHALPEYVWWKDISERRRVNGRYGAGIFGNLGRTGLEISATRTDDARFISREIEQQTNTREEEGTISLEVDVGGGFSIFGSASLRQLSFLPEEGDEVFSDFEALERDEDLLRAGVRVFLPRGLTLGLGVESSEVDFTKNGDRSNSGTSPVLQLDYDASRYLFAVNVAFRDLEAEPGSRFVPYDDVTGTFRSAWRLGGTTELQLFGDQNLVYSIDGRWAYFEDAAIGIGVKTAVTARFSIRIFAEDGRDDYAAFEPTTPQRTDDFQAFGGTLQFGLGRFTLTLGASETDYDSNLPEFDRTTTIIRSGITLGLGGSPWG